VAQETSFCSLPLKVEGQRTGRGHDGSVSKAKLSGLQAKDLPDELLGDLLLGPPSGDNNGTFQSQAFSNYESVFEMA
jgi:hypothetical protein